MQQQIFKLIGTIALIFSAFSTFSQANYQGSIIIDPYYGYPNFGASYYSLLESNSTVSSFKSTGIGPAGLRAEYMVGDKIGVGFDFIYNSNTITNTNTDSTAVFNTITSNYDYSVTVSNEKRIMQRVRFQARINFHFDISNPALDAYFGVGVGTNNRFRKYYVNGVEQVDSYTTAASSFTLFPVSMRICTGVRYYFSPNVGLNMELGLGGPMISAGISCKIK